MENLFETVLGMSGTASIVILLVLLARLALRKAPRVFSYALWAVALFRLLCPFTMESAFSLLPSAQVVSVAGRGESAAQVIQVQTGIAPVDRQVNDFFVDHPYQGLPARSDDAETIPAPPVNQEGPAPDWRTVPAAVWLAGAGLLLGCSLWSLLRLRRALVGWTPLAGEKNVRLADHIPSPFVLGLVFPKIYLPSGLRSEERDYILLHERTHIRRGDHIFRALAWLALAVHWFNPLVWLSFHLAGKDMEMSCDEAVLRKMGRDVRADYSASLLRLSQGGRLPAGPLAFGGGDPRGRIQNVLRYKKPAAWVLALALAGVVCAGAALATDPEDLIDPESVASVTAIRTGSSYTETERHTIVYTEADRQEDLVAADRAYTLSGEQGAELVRLINLYRRTVYARGELKDLSGWEHNLYRIDCASGEYYVVDYWYWNGFSFNLLHGGEDSYTTLVTYYDPQGVPGTTWQMEYSFDHAYKDWRSGFMLPPWNYDTGELNLNGWVPRCYLSDIGTVSIEGLGGAYVECDPAAYGGLGALTFCDDPKALCPPLGGRAVLDGLAKYEDETTLSVSFGVYDERAGETAPGELPAGFRIAFTVDLSGGAVIQSDFQSMIEGDTLELTDWEMAEMARILDLLMQEAQECRDQGASEQRMGKPGEPYVLTMLGVSYSLNETGDGVAIGGLDCGGMGWMNREIKLSLRLGAPQEGALGYLTLSNPRFLDDFLQSGGGYFSNAFGNAVVCYYPEEDGPLLAVGFDDYTEGPAGLPRTVCFVVDLMAREVKKLELGGFGDQAPEFSDQGLVTAAGALAGLIEGAADYYEIASNPPPEEGPMPFDQPLRLWFGSGAGAWRTIMTLHPDGSFEGRYDDSDMGVTGEDYPFGTQSVCIFHGRFGDVEQVTDASWSLTLEELELDTGHPLAEKWIEEGIQYVSAAPYGFDNAAGGVHPGVWFMLYAPEASGRPGGELYGMEDESSELNQFWHWWPDKRDWGPDSTLGSWGLRNMETGYGFFDLSAWGIAPEQPRN